MSTSAEGPLAGIGVVETEGEVATRYAGRLFAQLGASVWRVGAGPEPLDRLYAAWLDERKETAPSLEAALGALEAGGFARTLVIAGQTPDRIAAAETALAQRVGAPP